VALGLSADGSGVIHAIRTDGLAEFIARRYPDVELIEYDIAGPPTSLALRGAGWAEIEVARASLQTGPTFTVESAAGASASARFALIDGTETMSVRVRCGEQLDPVVLRSYCIGAAHMAIGWVTSEGLSVDSEGLPHDLTIRSFGVLRAVDTPTIDIELVEDFGEPVNGSDAVFAAAATAVWAKAGLATRWPTGRSS
jgi:hypothetical protein